MYLKEEYLYRHPENPIIKPADFEDAYATFNCGQTIYKGKTILLVAVQHKSFPSPCIHVAESDDGVHFTIRKEPFITRSENSDFKQLDTWTIDPRVTYIPEDDMYYITRPLDSSWGTAALLCRTKDFETYEEMDIIALPHNRVPCIFGGKVNGKYVRLDRPNPKSNGDGGGRLWISFSNDLIHWGEHRPLLAPFTLWNWTKIGPTPPVKTKDGWFSVIHGVTNSCSGRRYSIGAMLLDLEDPTKIIGKTMKPILTPDAPYEYMGTVPNVVFPCGFIADEEKDELKVYYGAADTYVGLASGRLSEVINLCKDR